MQQEHPQDVMPSKEGSRLVQPMFRQLPRVFWLYVGLLTLALLTGIISLPSPWGIFTFGLGAATRDNLSAALIGGAIVGLAVLGIQISISIKLEEDARRSLEAHNAAVEKHNLELRLVLAPDLVGWDFAGEDLAGLTLNKVVANNSRFHQCDLREVRLRQATLDRADLREARLSGSDLSNASLRGADLRKSWLVGTDLSVADLRDAELYGADLTDADLLHANLTGAKLASSSILVGCELSHAVMNDAILTWANLTSATMRGTHLVGAELMSAALDEVDMSDANLLGADLRRVGLENVTLKGAAYDDSTRWPNGYEPEGTSYQGRHALCLQWNVPVEAWEHLRRWEPPEGNYFAIEGNSFFILVPHWHHD